MERVILRHLKGSKASQLEEFPLQQFAELTLGRDPNSSVRFDPDKDDLVGRQHARISRDAADPYRFRVQDLNSRNGTFLNKLRVVGEMPLQPGDVIQLGAGGPELQFDLDPLPALYVKATRLDAAAPAAVEVVETRVTATAGGPVAGTGAPSAPASNAIGKATVERLIGETRTRANRSATLVGVAAVVLVAGTAALVSRNARKDAQEAAAEQGQRVDSISGAMQRAGDLAKLMQPAEIAATFGAAVVQVDFSWTLIYGPAGKEVYHLYVPNAYKGRDGRVRPLVANGRERVPAYVVADGSVEPMLSLTEADGELVTVAARGTGFVVTSNGFIITNRHVAYNWQAPFGRFNQAQDIGPLVDPRTGAVQVDEDGAPIITRPPTRWIPSETKQLGPKRDMGDFQARVDYLRVRFPGDPNPLEAKGVRPSDRHDVALIKVDAPASLPYVTMEDSYTRTRQGDAVTVMGYPGVAEEAVAVINSRDMFNQERQTRVLPAPTLSTGNIGKILRPSEADPAAGFFTVAPSGDTYQLTINSTGGGNSGGPMFDGTGKVIGIYFAGKQTDAQISFAVPIRFAMELLKVGGSR